MVTPQDRLDAVAKSIEAAKIPVASARFTYLPQNTVPVFEEETAARILHLHEALDGHDDVQCVYANFDMPAELLAKVTAAA